MTKLEEMRTILTAYQPKAEAAGHGKSWAKMCNEKTAVAAYVAHVVAADAAYAAAADAAAEKWAQKAIDSINKLKEKNK